MLDLMHFRKPHSDYPSRKRSSPITRMLASRRNQPPRQLFASGGYAEPIDYHFSHYSLADGEGGVCIDMSNGWVRFDWKLVPLGQRPGAFATFVRRLHFRNGHHVDEPMRQIQVPARTTWGLPGC